MYYIYYICVVFYFVSFTHFDKPLLSNIVLFLLQITSVKKYKIMLTRITSTIIIIKIMNNRKNTMKSYIPLFIISVDDEY